MNSVNLDLKDYIIGAKKVTKEIDKDNISFSYKKSPLIFDWKNEGFKIEYILINDIFNWLCYLGLGDGFIADEEVEFIDNYLDLNFTKDQIRKLSISKLNKDFKYHIPASFILFCEAEIVDKNLMVTHSMPIYSKNLFALFAILGQSFISCDGEITSNEKIIYEEYLELLWRNLKNFRIKRGIDDTYENLVGIDVPIEDITINNANLNKKIINKMNLDLKLLSQGYSLDELNNIAFLSINIIVKWFYKGRNDDKNFKEFYQKSIKLNPLFEIDIDNALEDIDLNNVDEILDDGNNETKKLDYDSVIKSKNHDYMHQINEIQSQFHLKEQNTRNLIDKCFPAPQITNTKFNDDVDECMKLFSHKFECIQIILKSTQEYSVKLDKEVQSNIEVLKEINNNLGSLHDELLIKLSQRGDEDIENMLEEMGRLINSVKDY